MPPPLLPRELHKPILEYVDDQFSLFQFMLVCRAWRYQTLARLYRHPILYNRRYLLGFYTVLATTVLAAPFPGTIALAAPFPGTIALAAPFPGTIALGNLTTGISISFVISAPDVPVLTQIISRCPQLVNLEIHFAIMEEILEQILEKCGNTLTSLTLHDCHKLTRDAIEAIPRRCPNLCSVGLMNLNNGSMRKGALINLIKGYPALKRLDISRSHLMVNNATMKSLCELRGLRVLNLSGNKSVTEVGLLATMVELEELRLAGLEKATEDEIVRLVRSCTGIRRLDLTHTRVSEAVLEVLATELRGLKEVDVRFCEGVTPEVVEKWLPGLSRKLTNV